MLRFLRGYVHFKGEGGFPERLLSDAAALGLAITDSYKQGETLFARCPAAHYKKLRPLARRACMRLKICRKQGLYFRLFPYRKRVGLPVGMLLSILLFCFLSSRIWVVQIEAAEPVDEAAVLAAVEAQGVYPGCRIQDVDMRLLRLHALSDLEEMVYVSVNPSGCVARVTVNKRAPKPDIEDFHSNFSNLVAACDGKIISMEIHSGQATVKVGEGVTKGMLLVSGTVESPAGNLYLHKSSGKVIAETERTLSVTVPLSEVISEPSEEIVFRPSFRFLRWEIPLFSSGALQGTYTENVYYHLPQINGITLPVGMVERRLVRMRKVTVSRTAEQAAALAETRIQEELDALTAGGAQPLKELSRDGTTDGKQVTLSVTLLCHENIAVEIPLKFADNSVKN